MDVFNVIKKIYFIFDVFWKLPKLPKDSKNNWGSITFFLQLKLKFFSPLEGTTLVHLLQKFHKLIHVFNDVRACSNFQKSHFEDFGPLAMECL
jgi:hypothetical protein